MMSRRHDREEIAAKLDLAHEMAAKGTRQRDIARALGVSVMTYHRWRRMPRHADTTWKPGSAPVSFPAPRGDVKEIEDLRLENTRLRRLVTDLLLEKVRLDELFETGNLAKAKIRK
jgi:transposase-like protein